jgi:hypothetical protein
VSVEWLCDVGDSVSGDERDGWSFVVHEDMSIKEIPGAWATRAALERRRWWYR